MTTIRPPMCLRCAKYRNGLKCDAFPERIPTDILRSRHDHREPYPGDNGVRFEPVDREAAEIVDQMFVKE